MVALLLMIAGKRMKVLSSFHRTADYFVECIMEEIDRVKAQYLWPETIEVLKIRSLTVGEMSKILPRWIGIPGRHERKSLSLM